MPASIFRRNAAGKRVKITTEEALRLQREAQAKNPYVPARLAEMVSLGDAPGIISDKSVGLRRFSGSI